MRLFDIPAADPRWLGVPGFEEVVEVCLDLGLRIACCVLPDGLDDVARVLDLVAAGHRWCSTTAGSWILTPADS